MASHLPFDEDDMESPTFDNHRILGGERVNTKANGAFSWPEPRFRFQPSSTTPPELDYFHPDNLVIRNHNQNQNDNFSSTRTKERVFFQTTHDHDKYLSDTDGTAESNGEPSPRTTDETFGEEHYKYAYVLAALLLLITCGLGYILANLVQRRASSHGSTPSSVAQRMLPPSPPPSTIPVTGSPSTSSSPTRVPTPATRRPTDSPSEAPTNTPSVTPTISAPEHLLELLRDSATGKTMEAIGIPGTDQQKAYQWLHKDPNYFDYTAISKIQRFALAVLYYSTVQNSVVASEALETWMDYDTHECFWYFSWYENRLPCGVDGIFKFLALRNIHLQGTIPAELGLMTRLVDIVITGNALTGTIPTEFGEWTSLEKLDLHGNSLRGRLPNFRNVPKLKEINLSLNTLTGFVPASIGTLDITSLDLTQNPRLEGVMPFQLCSLSDQIDVLAADCGQVYCYCCTRCDSSVTRTPSIAPATTTPRATPRPTPRPTAAPSLRPILPPTGNTNPPPTNRPTPPPTNRPTPFPSQRPTPAPTPTPTNRPTPGPTIRPLPLPTPQPTLDPNCMDNVRTSKQCYVVGEPIDVVYSNCNPTFADWIGIFDVNTPENALFDPLLSHPTCINEPCSGVQQISTLYLDGGVRGSSNWPLSGGRYKVYMFRGGSFLGPYTHFSRSLIITISETSC